VCESRGELLGLGQGLAVCVLNMGFVKCGEILEEFSDSYFRCHSDEVVSVNTDQLKINKHMPEHLQKRSSQLT